MQIDTHICSGGPTLRSRAGRLGQPGPGALVSDAAGWGAADVVRAASRQASIAKSTTRRRCYITFLPPPPPPPPGSMDIPHSQADAGLASANTSLIQVREAGAD